MARRVQSLYSGVTPTPYAFTRLSGRQWPAPGPGRKYPWETWADGSVWQLSRSELKGTGGFRNFRTLMSEWANRNGLTYQSTVSDDKTKIRFRFM